MKIYELTEHRMPDIDISKKIVSMIHQYAFLLPPWVQELRYGYDEDLAYVAMSSSRPDYLYHRVTFSDRALIKTDDELLDLVLHELAHAYTTPPVMPFRQFVDDESFDQKSVKAVSAHSDERVEMSTQALANQWKELIVGEREALLTT